MPPEAVPDLDPQILAALEKLEWGNAADRLEDFYVISPSIGAWVIQYIPVFRAAAEGNLEDAAFMLHPGIYENFAPKAVHDRALVALARALDQAQPWVAAQLWIATGDPKLAERGNQIARRLQGKVEDIPVKFNEALAARAANRVVKNGGDVEAMQWKAWALLTSDPDNAYTTAERTVALDPTAKRAWSVLAEIARRAGRDEKAVERVFDQAADRNPDAAWPFLEQAKLLSATDFGTALGLAERALQSDGQDYEACELRRKMLRKLEKWQELVEHIEYMAGLTSDRQKLAELYDEWARVTSDPLKDPVGAVELQKQASFFANEKEVSDFYWKNLQENEKDKRVWDEVEYFFRQNRMWNDLGKLILMRLERAMGDERLVFVDQLRIVWGLVPGRGEAAWIDLVQTEIDRASKDAELKKAFESRLEGVEVPEPEAEKADVASYVLVAAGLLLVLVVILVAILLMPFFIK